MAIVRSDIGKLGRMRLTNLIDHGKKCGFYLKSIENPLKGLSSKVKRSNLHLFKECYLYKAEWIREGQSGKRDFVLD